jgi:hypothetical protein
MKEDIENTSAPRVADEKPRVVRKSLRVRTNVHAGPSGAPVMPIVGGNMLK